MRSIKNWILAIAFIFIYSNNLGAIYCLNDIEEAYPPVPKTKIKGIIIEGASLFLQSYSQALLFLNEGEIAEKGEYNYEASIRFLEGSISKLQQSKDKYQQVLSIVSEVEYDSCKIDQLKSFAYEASKYEKFVNYEIFETVKNYLSNGDVKGIYMKNIDYIEQANEIMYRIIEQVKNGDKPLSKDCGELIRVYSHTLLFGNYATTLAKEAFGE